MTKANIKLSNLAPNNKVIKAQSIKDAMQASGNFPANSMPINYTAIQTYITNLQNAIVAASAANSSAADTTNLHEQERILVNAFNFIRAHVEFVANNSTDPATIITSAGMLVSVLGGINSVTELTLDALTGGTVNVRLPRQVGEKAFVVETSSDGTNWVQANMSSLTKIKLTGLTTATTLQVRYYAISKTGRGTTSQVKTIIVI